MQNYGTLRAELDVRRMEHALVVDRAARMALLGVEQPRWALAAAVRRLMARLLRRSAAVLVSRTPSDARCGAIGERRARRCVACGGNSVRPAHRAWRGRGRCVRRRADWARGRQHA
jgi:hypothetical protein